MVDGQNVGTVFTEGAPERKALEVNFPFENLHRLAELESWRKEVNRPIYHVHKWWANRLGSVFRAILLGAGLPETKDAWPEFYSPKHHFGDMVVLDPFMGSGTTIGEALKLGYRAVGVDINPVAYFQVKTMLGAPGEEALSRGFERLEERVGSKIQSLYRSKYKGQDAHLLYTFWVKVLPCPDCGNKTQLFAKRIFSSNAYPKNKPQSWAVCPFCGEVNEVLFTDSSAVCRGCHSDFDPQRGCIEGQSFRCPGCGGLHRTLDVVRRLGRVPQHEMYALMLLLPNGKKVYKAPDECDRELFESAKRELATLALPIPNVEIPAGHNTNQARSYNYLYWHEMFNERQLLALGTLFQGILSETDQKVREALLMLASGVLEFNNMFCSFKGEGTGAVRHLFAHHILKPERTPLEANPWGTDKSSGSFSTLFERRLLAAVRYKRAPFELRVASAAGKIVGEKVFGVNRPLSPRIASNFAEVAERKADVLVMASDSGCLPLPDASVDLVVTDPPYFDNVHYSELADFFFCWLQQGLAETDPAFAPASTRHGMEVQSKDAGSFSHLLGRVLSECSRVLKAGGIVAFTFQHARWEAWAAVLQALRSAGLEVVAVHPVKAEMSVSMPKLQAREPINLDQIIVCRHRNDCQGRVALPTGLDVARDSQAVVSRYNKAGIKLSRGDIRAILMGSCVKLTSPLTCEVKAREALDALRNGLEKHLNALDHGQDVVAQAMPGAKSNGQLALDMVFERMKQYSLVRPTRRRRTQSSPRRS